MREEKAHKRWILVAKFKVQNSGVMGHTLLSKISAVHCFALLCENYLIICMVFYCWINSLA